MGLFLSLVPINWDFINTSRVILKVSRGFLPQAGPIRSANLPLYYLKFYMFYIRKKLLFLIYFLKIG